MLIVCLLTQLLLFLGSSTFKFYLPLFFKFAFFGWGRGQKLAFSSGEHRQLSGVEHQAKRVGFVERRALKCIPGNPDTSESIKCWP